METTTTNAPAVLTGGRLAPELLDKLKNLRATMPEDRQLSWLQLGNAKAEILRKLDLKALDLQRYLIDTYGTQTAEELAKNIALYERGLKELVEMRKGYTKYLDRIFDELIGIEKRAAAWDVLGLAKKRELTLREELEAKTEAANAKLHELEAFKTHVKNEYVRIASTYEVELNRTITNAYTQALKDTLTDDGLKQYLKVTEAALRGVKLSPTVRFMDGKYQHHTKEELQAVHPTIPAPNWTAILDRYIKAMLERFKLYFNDLQNAEKAADAVRAESQRQQAAITETAADTQAVNNLTGKAATTIAAPALVKRKMAIKIQDSDAIWANRVIGYFLANFKTCAPRLKIKSWANLTVKQMAAALQEEDEMFDGIEYEEIKK